MEAEEFMLSGRWLDLASLILTTVDLITSRVSEKDLECIFTVICNLVTRANTPDEALEMAQLISAKVVQQPTDRPALRLKILFNLYNLLENPYSKFFVYTKALDLAASGKVTENIIPSFKKIDSFLQEWNIGRLDMRQLFRSISNILKDNKSMAKDSFAFLTRYLATFSGSGEDASSMNEAKEEAVQAVVDFVRSPDIVQCDLLDLPAVAQLEKDAKYSLVYQLLKIFVAQRLDTYIDFHATNATLLKNYGLVHEDCITKMRLMSLLDLSSNESGEIPYSLIRDTLQITDDEVEYWVVKAIASKHLSCKMDQMNQVVIVSRHTARVFGLSEWQNIHSKLSFWKRNIANVISTLQANKISEGVQGVQGQAIR
ncbi:eukaryotic translation initiation factor 3 subunit M-like [Zingiber officinale]|nr:eukaryotic translation initiation factor 3 subunit M-like [Zingiber officinale]